MLLPFSALDMDHCSSQLKSGEHPGPSTHKHTTVPHSPPAQTDSDTNMHPLVNTHKNIHMHTNMYPLNTYYTYLNAHWHCSVLLFACTVLNTHISWEKKADMKLKLATKSWNWPSLTSYQTGPIINQFLYLSYSSLSILCVCSLSPSLYTIFFLQLLCTSMKKVAVQPSLQYKQLETMDWIKKQFLV